MIFETLRVGQMQTNCYVVRSGHQPEAWIFDPGDDAEYIADYCVRNGIKPQKIIATHGHFDHLMSAYDLCLIFNIPLAMSQKDEFLVERVEESARYFLGDYIQIGKPVITENIKGNSQLSFAGEKIKVIATPGHTPGGLSFYFPDARYCISGDTVFAGGLVGNTRHKYSDPLVLAESIDRILKLPRNTILLPGHGDSFTVGEYKIAAGK